jgi:hypothetical protein
MPEPVEILVIELRDRDKSTPHSTKSDRYFFKPFNSTSFIKDTKCHRTKKRNEKKRRKDGNDIPPIVLTEVIVRHVPYMLKPSSMGRIDTASRWGSRALGSCG